MDTRTTTTRTTTTDQKTKLESNQIKIFEISPESFSFAAAYMKILLLKWPIKTRITGTIAHAHWRMALRLLRRK